MLQLKEDEEEAVKKIPLGLRKEKERKKLKYALSYSILLIFLVLEANLSNLNVATPQNIIIVFFFSYFSFSKLQFHHKRLGFLPFSSLFNK